MDFNHLQSFNRKVLKPFNKNHEARTISSVTTLVRHKQDDVVHKNGWNHGETPSGCKSRLLRQSRNNNIQDNSLVHVAKSNLSGKVLPTIIGDNVTVGYSSVLHGCTVEDEAFVGMGATLLDGVVVEKQNSRIPSGEIWAGNPAKFLRKLTAEEISFISQSTINYSNLAQVRSIISAP